MTQSYYAIAINNCSGTEYTQNAIKLVNSMLALGVDVWWLQKRVRGAKRVYTRGDFVIAFNSFSAVRYLLNMADELGVTVNRDSGLDESRLVVVARKMVKPKIAVYYGNGTTGGAIWFIQALEDMGFDTGIVTAKDILEGALRDYNVLLLGSGGDYCTHLGKEGCKEVTEFVYNGGGYIGHCGGSVAAVSGYHKSGPSSWLELADARLEQKESGNILSAYARGPVIYAITTPEHPVMFGYECDIALIYWCGPIFSSEVGDDVTVLATISAPSQEIQLTNPELTRVRGLKPSKKAIGNSTGKPAIIAAEYGQGKVVLSSPHPESPGSEHTYRLLANEVFYVSSVYKSHNPNELGASDTSTRNLLTDSIIVSLEKLLRAIYNAVEMMRGSEDIDIEVYGAIAEFMLLYLNDSAQRLEKVINFYTLVFASRSIDDTVITKAINKINRLATSETLEVVKATITFLGDHYKSLNRTLALREALNGTITDEYSNLVNMAYASFTDALDVYKCGVAAKILDASFAVTKAEEAVKFVGISIKH
jgi:glutamine amidotransferase-like uncharacterized protein